GHLTVRAAPEAILVVARLLIERPRPNPELAIRLVAELARGDLLQVLLGEVQVAHVALLRRPHVELDAVVAQDAPLLLDDPRHGVPPEALEPRPFIGLRHERLERLEGFRAPRALLLEALAAEIGQALTR